MPTTAESYYSAPEEFAGKSLQDLSREGQLQGRSDLIARILGIGENQRFSSGQQLTARDVDTGSSEGQFLASRFKAGMSPSQQAVQPAIQTLESGKAPLKERYSKLLESIKGRRETQLQQTDVNTARELGRRGITTDSTFAGQYGQQQRLPVEQEFGQLEAETGLNSEMAQQNILNSIANLQAGAGQNEVQRAMDLLRMQQDQSQFESQQGLTRELNQPKASSLETQVIEVGGRKKLINTQTGQVISDLGVSAAPSTYSSNLSSYLPQTSTTTTRDILQKSIGNVTRPPLSSFNF